jgi:hypothetical protein
MSQQTITSQLKSIKETELQIAHQEKDHRKAEKMANLKIF